MTPLAPSSTNESTWSRWHVARALPTVFRIGFASAVAYRGEFLIWILSTNMPLVMLALWTQVAREAPVGRFGENEFVAYFLATLIVRLLTGSWVVWEMTMDIRQGNLGMRLLRPIHPFVAYAAENLAAIPFRAIVALPVALVALAWAGTGAIHATWIHLCVAPIAVLGAWSITFTSMLAVGTLALFWESALAVYELWMGLYFVLSGYLVPLALFPPTLREIGRWLPFRYCLDFPVETILGGEPASAVFRDLVAQWAWAAAFLALSIVLWRRGLARYAMYGG